MQVDEMSRQGSTTRALVLVLAGIVVGASATFSLAWAGAVPWLDSESIHQVEEAIDELYSVVTDGFERNDFFQGKLLTAEDFEEEQTHLETKLDVIMEYLEMGSPVAGVPASDIYYLEYGVVAPNSVATIHFSPHYMPNILEAGKIFVVSKVIIQNSDSSADYSVVGIDALSGSTYVRSITTNKMTRGINAESIIDLSPGLPLLTIEDGTVHIADSIRIWNYATSTTRVWVHVYGYVIDAPG
jgi:hypothetical protein